MYGQLAGVLTPIVMRIIGVVLLLTVLVSGGIYLRTSGYNAGYAQATLEGTAKMATYVEEQRAAVAKLDAQARAIEQELQGKLLQSLVEKENEVKAINELHDRLVSELRKRPSRTSRPQQPASPDPKPATIECPRAVSTGKELSREDGEFLAGEAASADTLREALRLCRRAYENLIKETK